MRRKVERSSAAGAWEPTLLRPYDINDLDDIYEHGASVANSFEGNLLRGDGTPFPKASIDTLLLRSLRSQAVGPSVRRSGPTTFGSRLATTTARQ